MFLQESKTLLCTIMLINNFKTTIRLKIEDYLCFNKNILLVCEMNEQYTTLLRGYHQHTCEDVVECGLNIGGIQG